MNLLPRDLKLKIYGYLRTEPCSFCRIPIYIDINSQIKSNIHGIFCSKCIKRQGFICVGLSILIIYLLRNIN